MPAWMFFLINTLHTALVMALCFPVPYWLVLLAALLVCIAALCLPVWQKLQHAAERLSVCMLQ